MLTVISFPGTRVKRGSSEAGSPNAVGTEHKSAKNEIKRQVFMVLQVFVYPYHRRKFVSSQKNEELPVPVN